MQRNVQRWLGGLAIAIVFTAVQAPTAASAKEFDITGTIDCGTPSGHRCDFTDWESGPVIAIITEDISGSRERVLVDASWVKNDLGAYDQDDFVWLTLRDGSGPNLQAIGVVDHHCNDGRVSLGLVNQGRSDGGRCRR